MAGGREVVIDYEFLRGRQNETVVKELCVASAPASETFRFKGPYKMADHGSSINGLKWADRHIEYKELHRSSLRPWPVSHTSTPTASLNYILCGLTGRPIHNQEGLACSPPVSFNHKHWCTLPCHKFPKFPSATKTAHSLYDWLMYYLQKKDFVECPPDVTRHCAEFVAAL